MRILVAVDGTHYSDLAVALTVELTTFIKDVAVTIVTVSKQKKTTAARVAILEKAATVLEPVVASVTQLIVENHAGHPAEAILKAAEGHDLLVMGKRPSTDWRARLMGPTTRQVINHAKCPVLIAKETITPLRHLLLCDSGMQTPPLLTRFLNHISDLITPQTDITVLHVMSQISAAPGIRGVQLRADADELMDSDAWEGQFLRQDEELLARVGVPRRIKVRHGLVLDEILRELEDDGYDLLVIGSHHVEGIPDFLLEDISRQLIVKAQRPVLVLPG